MLGGAMGSKKYIGPNMYCSLPIIRPPILCTSLSLKWGEGLYSSKYIQISNEHKLSVDPQILLCYKGTGATVAVTPPVKVV